jgi:hypothetical protein
MRDRLFGDDVSFPQRFLKSAQLCTGRIDGIWDLPADRYPNNAFVAQADEIAGALGRFLRCGCEPGSRTDPGRASARPGHHRGRRGAGGDLGAGRVEMKQEDAADLGDGVGVELGRVAGAHDQLRLDALDVGAAVAHHAVAALLGRAVALNPDDRVGGHPGATGISARPVMNGLPGVMPYMLPKRTPSGLKRSASGFAVTISVVARATFSGRRTRRAIIWPIDHSAK